MANEFIARRGLIVLSNGAKITGSLEINGTVSSSGGFSGSGANIFGVVSSSYATTSSLALNNITNASVNTNVLTFTKGDGSTFNVTISQSGSVESASFANTSSFASTAATASYVEYTNVANKPTLISSSAQFTNPSAPFTGSFSGSFFGDGSGLTGIASTLGISGSTGNDTVNLKTEALTITGSNGITTTITNNTVTINLPVGTISASSQVDHDATTNFVANEHIDHSTVSITAGGGLTGGGNITATRTLTLDTGSVHFVSGAIANVLNPKAVFSSSAQVSYTGLSNIPSGIVSSSTQIPALLPNGTISASSQVQLASITGTTFAAADYTFPNNLTVGGRLTAQEFYTELVSSSVIYESGSTKFGDSADDRHSFTGTLEVTGSALIQNVLYTSGTNLDVDTGTEIIATVSSSVYDAAFFDYVVKKGANYRAGTVMAVWDGTNVEFTDTSTNDLGNTAEVLFSVDILSGQTRLKATVSTNDWIIKTAVRAL